MFIDWSRSVVPMLCNAQKHKYCYGYIKFHVNPVNDQSDEFLMNENFEIFCMFNSLFIFIFVFLGIGQRTTPTELPIYGDPFTEIALELVFPKGNPLFLLNGKTLELLQPLDRDKENLSHIVFQVNNYKKHSRK